MATYKKLNFGDRLFNNLTLVFALMIPIIFVLIISLLTVQSWVSIKEFGWGFLTNSVWDPVQDQYGALTFIYGTVVSAVLALLIAVPIGLGAAIYLSEIAMAKSREVLSIMLDMLAAIPSVVYGLWGIFVLGPLMVNFVQPFLQSTLGFLPIFQGEFQGSSMLTAGVILAIMILPTIISVSREVLQVVPRSLRESAMALGCTRWETIRLAVLPPSLTGIFGAVMLALGRALGETMAVTMVIGNKPHISASLFNPGYTLSAVIANEFTEAVSTLNYAVLFELGLILLIITIIMNGIAKVFIWKLTRFAK
jgi:phosphate transport system permease protein